MSATTYAPAAETVVAQPRHRQATLGVLADSWRYGRTKVGVFLTLLIVALALFGPLVAPHSPTAFVAPPYAKPSGAAPLGADYLGHDVLSRVLWGGRSVLWMAFSATAIGVFFGLALGLIAGYARNTVDDVIMRSLDVVYSLPNLVLVLLFVSLLGPKKWLVVLLVALAWVPGVARIARGITLEAVTREFVEVAEAMGVPRRRILVREVLPNLMTPLLVEFPLRLTWAVGAIAAISFLGFGVQPPQADWGLMINENRNGLTVQPWAVVVPILCIALFTIGTNLLAEGISRTVAGIDREVVES
jgi:peptide/nickel transport system permease protein